MSISCKGYGSQLTDMSKIIPRSINYMYETIGAGVSDMASNIVSRSSM